MKKYLLLSLLLCFAFTGTETYNGLATTRHEGVGIFVNAVPVNAYTVVGKASYSNTKKNESIVGADPSGLRKVVVAIDEALEKVEKGKQDQFQAAIVYSPLKIELINFSEGILETNAACIVGTKDYSKKCGAKEIFLLSKPSKPYTEAKLITVENFTNLGQMKYGKNDIDNFLNKIYERSCKEAKAGVDFDAVMIINDNETIRGLLESKSLSLIKYD